MKRYMAMLAGSLILASCTIPIMREHVAVTPPDEGCGHCHYMIYKEWRISYKPYEELPLPGNTADQPVYPQYHFREPREAEPARVVTPSRKDCTACHVNITEPQGKCSREKAGFR